MLPFSNILQIPVAGGWFLHILDSSSTFFLDTLVVGVRHEVGTGSQSVVEKAGWGRMDGEGAWVRTVVERRGLSRREGSVDEELSDEV